MNKIIKLVIIFATIFIYTPCLAQKKYAVLVGINTYYEAPGQEYQPVLRGCVNDAMAIKSLLINRFNFSQNNIKLLTNASATKANVLEAFTSLLKIVNPGDVVVYYFSGHGVWISNAWQSPIDKKIKEGMNQAMVMSDLYSDNYGCLFTDALVKKIFNKFVDKKVIVTSIFDCCFSGKISSVINIGEKAPYLNIETDLSEKAINLLDIPEPSFSQCVLRPGGCNIDSINQLLAVALYDSSSTKSFDISASLRINDSTYIIPPSKRTGSRFASLSSSTDYQKSLDIKDETGIYHGAFTKALLQTLNSNATTLSVKDIFSSIESLLKIKGYTQVPMHSEDPQRLTKNLIGITINTNDTRPKAIVKTVTPKNIILNGTLYDGFATGNILSLNGKTKILTLKVTDVDTSSMEAIVLTGNTALLKPGSLFIRTNDFIATKPLIKLCILSIPASPRQFNSFFEKQITPLVQKENYWDYSNWYITEPSRNIFFKDLTARSNMMLQNSLLGLDKQKFFVYLPIPTYIISQAKKLLQTNQNIQLVSSPLEADYTLYLNYVKGENPGYVFTWYNFSNADVNNSFLQLLPFNAKISRIELNDSQLTEFSKNLYAMTINMIQKKTGRWLNDMPVQNTFP